MEGAAAGLVPSHPREVISIPRNGPAGVPRISMHEHGPNFTTKVLDRMVGLRERVVRSTSSHEHLIGSLHSTQRESARNLLDYLALRKEDMRELQLCLHELGLSTLGTVESHTLHALDAVINALSALCSRKVHVSARKSLGFHEVCTLAEEKTCRLLGPRPPRRAVRIMLTLDPESASVDTRVMQMLKAGVNCVRINTAHDSFDEWKTMIGAVRSASVKLGVPCVVTSDLEGPKIRTGAMALADGTVTVKVKRAASGEVSVPALVRLTTSPTAPSTLASTGSAIAIPLSLPIKEVDRGSVLLIRNFANRKALRLVVLEANAQEVLVQCNNTLKLTAGLSIWELKTQRVWNIVAQLPQRQTVLPIKAGDRILVSSDESPGGPADATHPLPHISVVPGWLLQHVQVGECIKFDDGRIESVVQERTPRGLVILIKQSAQLKPKLRADMGVNFPQSNLPLPAVGADDAENIRKLAPLVDAFSLSFVHRPEEIQLVHRLLAEVKRENVGIILKIETAAAFARLPELLLAAMRGPTFGVMIARGDLAVEVGWHRLAELQEEILWLSEAAHVPVIWATQVLESLTKLGIPSRAEVSDASMAGRAECVMLNKGKFVLSAVSMLDDILSRMAAHQFQKMSLLRPLNVAKIFSIPKEDEPAPSVASEPKAKL